LSSTESKLYKLILFDDLSKKDVLLNSINPVVKIITLSIFIVMLISVNKYNIVNILLLTSFTVFLINISPLNYFTIVKFILILSPFILMIIIFNPMFDKKILQIGLYTINAGYISAITTFLKFANTTAVSLLIVASTNFFHLSAAFSKLKIPKYVSLQFILMYRFIFLFISDVINTIESIKSRGMITNKISFNHMKGIVSTFFMRALFRGEEVYDAMLSRGFDINTIKLEQKISKRDILFLLLSISYITLMRTI
jgi:cobalt/nickel transport system permease protein